MSPCQTQMQTSPSTLSLARKARAPCMGPQPKLAVATLRTLVLMLLHCCTALVAQLGLIRRLLPLMRQLRLDLMALQRLQTSTLWHSLGSRWRWRSPWAGCRPPVQLSASGWLRWTLPWCTSQGSRLHGSGIRWALHSTTAPASLLPACDSVPCCQQECCLQPEVGPLPGLGMTCWKGLQGSSPGIVTSQQWASA